MKKILIGIVFAVIAFTAAAQEEGKTTNQLESRIYAEVEKEFLKDKSLSVSFSPEFRFAEPFKYDKTLLKLGVSYNVMGWFKIGVGGRAVFNETKKRGTETWVRLDADISKNIKIWKFRLKPRIRYCNYQEIKTKDEKTDMLRYRLLLGFKYGKKAIFEPEAGAELFHNLNSGLISSIRYSVGGDFRINKHNYIAVAYMLETEFKTRINTHIAEVGYKFKF